tara:strand:+ start:368 stop:541 length:174 start_codon:yes stop_codon:yes gene_type:complete
MTNTIIINTDKELDEAINKYGKNITIEDRRPNNNKDQEHDRHVEEIENERIKETGQL